MVGSEVRIIHTSGGSAEPKRIDGLGTPDKFYDTSFLTLTNMHAAVGEGILSFVVSNDSV